MYLFEVQFIPSPRPRSSDTPLPQGEGPGVRATYYRYLTVQS
jgi:hypothetical protein